MVLTLQFLQAPGFGVALEHLFIATVGLALLYYLGAGLCRWLPAELSPYRWLIAPWVGYSLLVVITQFLTNSPFALTALQSVYFAIALATVLNVLRIAYCVLRKGFVRYAIRNTQYAIVCLSVGVFVLCVVPLWSYGYATVIGENWDAEIYLGLGEYLKVYPQSGLSAALPNPILDTIINPPYGLRTHGFSYFQAALGILPLDSLHTLAPLLALLRALSIPACFVFFRIGLRLPSGASLLASAALGLNAFLLWITYNMFGMQVPTFGLLPLSVCATLVLLNSASKTQNSKLKTQNSLWVGLFVAAMAVTYHPALTAFVAMVGPVVVALIVLHWRDGGARRILWPLGLAALAAIALSLVSQLKSLGGFLKQYGEKTGGLGLTGFTSPADAFGFSLSFRDLLPGDPGRPILSLVSRLYEVAGWLALLVAFTLIMVYLYGLWSKRGSDEDKSWAWAVGAMLAGAAVYALLFLGPLDYPYGWFKALAFVSFALMGGAAGGLWRIIRRVEPRVRAADTVPLQRGRTRRLPLRGTLLPPVVGFALLGLMLITTWLTVGRYWGEPLRFNQEMIEVGAVRDVILRTKGDDSTVYVSNSPNMQRLGRLYNGLLSYFLRDTELYGKFDTANSKLNREKPDGLYTYSLLNSDDSPTEYGVADATLVWHNSLTSLYASRPAPQRLDLYHHNYRGDGQYPEIIRDQPLYVSAKPDGIDLSNELPSAQTITNTVRFPLERQITLGLAAFTTTTLQIQLVNAPAAPRTENIVAPPGYTIYRSAPVSGTSALALSTAHVGDGGGTHGVAVRWAHLEKFVGASGQEPGLTSDGPGLLVSVGSTLFGQGILTRIGYLNNRSGAVSQTLSLDIYSAGKSGGAHYGYWNVSVPVGIPVNVGLSLDPVHKSLALDAPPGASLADHFAGTTGDGSYTASILVYENGHVSETFNDVFAFEIKGGKLASFKPRNLPPQFR